MKTIRKYQTGAAIAAGGAGAAGGEALMTVPGFAIPAALAWAAYNTYKHPENTAMSRGMREAEERLRNAYKQMEAEELAQVKRAAIANNKQLAEYYAKELANGPIVRNYADGFTTTITGYNPNTGRLTTVMNDPNRGWTFEGTAPELRYNYLNTPVNLEDELNGVVTTKYGTFTPEIDYVDWNTLKIKPGTLIEGLPGIAMSPPSGLTSPIKINPRAMVLSTGQPVVLPDITDYRVFDEAVGDQPAPAPDVEAAPAVEPTPAPAPQPTPEPEENGGGKNKGKGRGTGNRQRKNNESEFWKNFKQGRRDVVGNTNRGYRLGKVAGWLEEHPIWATIGLYGTYKGGKFLYDTFAGAPKSNEKDTNESDDTVDMSAVNGATTGTTGTATYQPDQIPTDSISMPPIVWPSNM